MNRISTPILALLALGAWVVGETFMAVCLLGMFMVSLFLPEREDPRRRR